MYPPITSMRSAVLLPRIEDLRSVGGSMPSEDGRPPTSALTFMASFHPFLQYFGILLEKGELDHLESFLGTSLSSDRGEYSTVCVQTCRVGLTMYTMSVYGIPTDLMCLISG